MLNKCLTLLLICMIAGCATIQKDWENAQRINTAYGYKRFLSEHSQSEFGQTARDNIEKLEWDKARQVNTAEVYRAFVLSHPQSEFGQIAGDNIEKLEWDKARQVNTAEAYRSFLSSHPQSEFGHLAQKELEKYKPYTVDNLGEILWEADKTLTENNADIVIELKGSIYSAKHYSKTINTFKNKVDRLSNAALKKQGFDIGGFEREMSWFLSGIESDPEKTKKLNGNLVWFLFADNEGDFIRVSKGKVSISTPNGNSVEIKNGTAFIGQFPKYSSFIIKNEVRDGKHGTVEFIPAIYVTDDIFSNGLSGLITYIEIDTSTHSFKSNSVSLRHHDVMLIGEAHFPDDEWIPLTRNFEVKGGGVKFTNNKIFLLPGTIVAPK